MRIPCSAACNNQNRKKEMRKLKPFDFACLVHTKAKCRLTRSNGGSTRGYQFMAFIPADYKRQTFQRQCQVLREIMNLRKPCFYDYDFWKMQFWIKSLEKVKLAFIVFPSSVYSSSKVLKELKKLAVFVANLSRAACQRKETQNWHI